MAPTSSSPSIQTLEALQHTLARQKQAWRQNPTPDAATREGRLQRLERMLVEHRHEWSQAMSDDFGHRSQHESQLVDVFTSLEAVRHARKHVRRWMRPERRPTSLLFFPGRNRLIYQPVGVVGVIVPWNYPLFLSFGPLASIFAAGNRAMVKMSELTPRTNALMARLVAQHFSPEELAIVEGEADMGRQFAEQHWDHLIFTGSTEVGRHVMKAAAQNLVPVTLELGGKSPLYLGRGAHLQMAAERIVRGKTVNAGQTCVAPDYVLMHRDQFPAWKEAMTAMAQRNYPGFADSQDYVSIISDRHFARLVQLREEARAAGAEVIPLLDAGPDAEKKRWMAPTLVVNPPLEGRLMQEEIFGPLLPVVFVDSPDDAIQFIQARPHPLALYVFEQDQAVVRQFLDRTLAGSVAVNDCLVQIAQADQPFGGVGPSGMGHYHGRDGFVNFSKAKPVFIQPRFQAGAWVRPPFGKAVERLLDVLIR